jgi:hypothetical protein
MSSAVPKAWTTPDNKTRHQQQQQQQQQQQRKGSFNNSSCGMTAPTAFLDGSASWTTMDTKSYGTRSRSDINSRSSRPNSRNNSSRRVRSAGAAAAQPVRLRVDDDGSSIESSSSHRRSKPAHLSLEMDDILNQSIQSIADKSCSVNVNNAPRNTSSRKQLRERQNHRRRQQQKSPGPSLNNSNCNDSSWIGSVFPNTSPRRPTTPQQQQRQKQQQQQQNTPSSSNNPTLASPYGMRRTGPLDPDGSSQKESAPTEVMHNLTTKEQQEWQQSHGEEPALSEAGAPTEVMTNRRSDILLRHPPPQPPPSARRRAWSPPEPSPKEAAMRSLMDDTSTEHSVSTNQTGQARPPIMASLLDIGSSSMSAPNSPATVHSRLSMHVHRRSKSFTTTDQDSASLQTGENSYQTRTSSVRVEIGAAGEVHRPAVALFGGRRIMGAGGPVFGGRQVGAVVPRRQYNATTGRLQYQTSNAPPALPPMDVDEPGRYYMPDNFEPPSPVSPGPPARYYMTPEKESPSPKKGKAHKKTPSYESTDSSTDGSDLMKASTAKDFVVYNQRKMQNADTVFQQRYMQSGSTSNDDVGSHSASAFLSEKEGLSIEYPEHRDHGKSPIQPIFSMDRLDLSLDSQSPIRKWRSKSQPRHAQPTRAPPTRSKSISEPIRRTTPEKASEQNDEPDPIFCPQGSVSFNSNEFMSPGMSPSSMMSPVSRSPGERGAGEDAAEMKQVVVKGWPLPKEDSSNHGIEEELVHIMDKSNQRRTGTSRPLETGRNISTVETRNDLHGQDSRYEGHLASRGVNAQNKPQGATDHIEDDGTERRTSDGYERYRERSTPRGVTAPNDMAPTTMNKLSQEATGPPESARTEKSPSVKDKIRAFNTVPPHKWNGNSRSKSLTPTAAKPNWKQMPLRTSTSRLSLLMGAHLAHICNDEENKTDEISVDMSIMESRQSTMYDSEDDDTASVKSLRDKFERHFSQKPSSIKQDDDDDDDDTASVRSLRGKLERRIMDQEEFVDCDDDGSVKSLRELFESPALKRESGAKVSNMRAMFETKAARAPGKRTQTRSSSWKDIRSRFESSAALSPANITSKNKSNQVDSFHSTPNYGPDEDQRTKPEIEKAEPSLLDMQITDVADGKAPKEGPDPMAQLPVDHVKTVAGASDGRDNDFDASARQAGFEARQVLAANPKTNVTPHRFEYRETSTSPKNLYFGGNHDAAVTNMSTSPAKSAKSAPTSRSHYDTSYQESKTWVAQKTHVPGPVTSPFMSMKDRLLTFSRKQNRSASNAHQGKPAPQTMHDRLNRWASRHHVAKRTPLAAQEELGGRIDDDKDEAEIARAGSYDLSSVVSSYDGEEMERHYMADLPERRVSKASRASSAASRSFDQFFSRTNKAIREKQSQRENSSIPKHSNRKIETEKAELVEGKSESDSRKSLEGSSADNRKDIFRRDGKGDGEVEVKAQKAPGSHWIAGNQNPENQRKGESTDTELSDGVTLDLSFADVSCLTYPTAIKSKESKEIDRLSSTSYSSVDELVAKKSEASSSQPSEALAPLLAGAMRLHPMSDEMSRDVKHHTNNDMNVDSHDKWDGKSEKGRQNSSNETNVGGNELNKQTEVGWDIEHVQISFPFRTASSDNLFDIDPEVDGGSFPDCDWPAFDQDDNDWTNPTPSEVTQRGASSKAADEGPEVHSRRPTTMAPVALEPREATTPDSRARSPSSSRRSQQNNQSLQAIADATAAQRHRTADLITTRRAASGPSQLTARPASPAQVSSASRSGIERARVQNAHHYSPTRPELNHAPAGTAVHSSMAPARQPAMTGRQPEARHPTASAHHNQTDSTNQRFSESAHGTPMTNDQPKSSQYEYHQEHSPSTDSGLSPHRMEQPMHADQHRPDVSASHSSETPALPLSSSLESDYEAIMESRHQMLLSRQRTHQQRRAARAIGKSPERDYHPQDPIGTTSSPSVRILAEPPDPPLVRSQTNFQSGRVSSLSGPAHAPTSSGFFGRTHPGQNRESHHPQHSHSTGLPSSYDGGHATQKPSRGARSRYSSSSQSEEMYDYIPTHKKASRNNTSPRYDTVSTPEFSDYEPADKSTAKSQMHTQPNRYPTAIPDPATPSPSLYSRFTSRLGLSNTGGMSKQESLIARLKAVKTSRLKRANGMNSPATSYRQQTHHPAKEETSQHYFPSDDFTTQKTPPPSYQPGIARGGSSASSEHRDDRSMSLNSAIEDDMYDTSASLRSSSQLFAAMLEVD